MKHLFFLFIIALFSCQKDEIIAPISDICLHTVTEHEGRILIKVVSELPHVTICQTVGEYNRCNNVVAHYYDCISKEKGQGVNKIEIIAETTCTFYIE